MKILVAGIGNIFMGDDAFGCEVARRLAVRALPEEVQLFDYGIRGLDLMYALLDHTGLVIFIDTVQRGGPPGTLYTIELDIDRHGLAQAMDAHGMDPERVLEAAQAMGARPGRILLVGCEPGDFGGEDGRMGLTPPVEAALDAAADTIEELIREESKKREVLR